MATKAILDVDLDTSKFQRFQELFGKYQEQLKKTPGMWAKAGEEQDAIAQNFEKMTAAMMAQSAINREDGVADKKRLAATSTSDRLWTSISKSTGSVAKNIAGATVSLLKWSGILTGLVGAGGLFGIDRMAAAVGDERRSAQGLGLSIGQQKSFGINFGRLVDPGAYLGWINGMEGDISKQSAAYGLMGRGLSGDTSKDAVAMLDSIRALAKRTPLQQLSPILGAYGINLSPEEQRRLKFGNDAEYADIKSRYAKDSSALNIPDGVAKEWQDFTAQMHRAGGEIFKTFAVTLVNLRGPLEHLSAGVVKFIETLGKSDVVKHAIDDLAGWLETFSGKISAPKFLESVERFTSDMGDLAQTIHNIVHPGDLFDRAVTSVGVALGHDGSVSLMNPGGGNSLDDAGKRNYLALLSALDKKSGLPAGMLEAQWQMESGSTLNPANSAKGAIGPMQIMDATAKSLGINPRNPLQAGQGAASLDADALKRYSGDIQKALAAYNWGSGNVDKDIAAHGKDWLRYAPKETQNYVTRGQAMITINNNTGGSAVVAVSQLGAN